MRGTRSTPGVVCSSYDGFLEVEKKTAGYMMEYKVEVVDMMARELAKVSGTSGATVPRFCRRCGFKGFHSLKLTLARGALEEERGDVNMSNEINRDKLSQSLQNILVNKVAELTEIVNMMNVTQLEQILDKLEHVCMVQLAAVGNTIPVALDGAFKLNQLEITIVTGDIQEAQAAYTFNLGPRDVVLVISNSGSSKRLQTLAKGTKENGCTLTLIANNGSSLLAEICDHKIVTATREKLLTEEFWFSRVIVTTAMKTLYLLLLSSKKDAMEYMRCHEKTISLDRR